MDKKLDQVLRGLLIFAGCYFIFDGLLHFIGIKLSSAQDVWPASASSYADLIDHLYASFIFLAALIAFIIQQDLRKYSKIVAVSAVWAFFHGLVLLSLVGTQNYQQIFKSLPSLLVWLPFYREYLLMNAILLFIYSGVAYAWIRLQKTLISSKT